MTPIRLAVIGAGHLGRIHARLACSLAGARLVGVADVSARARDEVAAEIGVPGVDDYRTLVGRIDGAIVATPTTTHYQIGAELLEAGVSLFIEKPLASNLAEAEGLVRLATNRRLVLQVGHVERFNPAFAAAHLFLHDVKYISAERLSGYPARSTDVGVVLDLMIHDLDLVQSIASAPLRHVDALGAAVIGPHEDLATARLEFENGCIANLTASRVSSVTRRTMQCFTSIGHVALDFATRKAAADVLRVANGDAGAGHRNALDAHLSRKELEAVDCNQIAEEQKEFVECLRGHAVPRVPGAAGRDAIALAERILESIARHEWDGHNRGRIGPHALPADAIIRSAA